MAFPVALYRRARSREAARRGDVAAPHQRAGGRRQGSPGGAPRTPGGCGGGAGSFFARSQQGGAAQARPMAASRIEQSKLVHEQGTRGGKIAANDSTRCRSNRRMEPATGRRRYCACTRAGVVAAHHSEHQVGAADAGQQARQAMRSRNSPGSPRRPHRRHRRPLASGGCAAAGGDAAPPSSADASAEVHECGSGQTRIESLAVGRPAPGPRLALTISTFAIAQELEFTSPPTGSRPSALCRSASSRRRCRSACQHHIARLHPARSAGESARARDHGALPGAVPSISAISGVRSGFPRPASRA